MKFCKSERQIHQPDYNPPCNVYQPDHLINSNKILTGSLAVPTLSSLNTFSYAPRFDHHKTSTPGPAAYFKDQRYKELEHLSKTKGKQKIMKQNLQSNPSTPSIPYNYYGQDADEEEIKYVKELLLSENIDTSSKVTKKKDPSYSFSKSERNLTNKNENPKKHTNPINQLIQYQNQIMNENQKMNTQQKKTSILWQQKINRANKRRLQVIQTLDPQFVPSLQLIQLIKKKKNKPTPGPSDYHNLQQVQPEFQIIQNPKGACFTSAKRFSQEKNISVGPCFYNPKNTEFPIQFSFSKSSRTSLQKIDDSNFRFYINATQNTSKSKNMINRPFGSGASRFPQVVNADEPALTLEEEKKRSTNNKLTKMIKVRQQLHKRLNSHSQKDEGLLGISTIASTID